MIDIKIIDKRKMRVLFSHLYILYENGYCFFIFGFEIREAK